MNRYDSLKKLYNEIELLESAGLIKAANVLHKKFVKEAQNAFGGLVTQDAKNFMMELDQAYNSGQPTQGVMQKAERAGLPPQEMQILKGHADKLRNQAKNDYDSKYSNTGYSTPNDTVAPSTRSVQDPTAPIGDLSDQVKAEQADIVKRGLGNSLNKAEQEQKERRLYMNALNDIILAFKEPNKEAGEAIFQNTVKQFQNPERKRLFINQIDRQRRKYFPQGPFLPEMSNEEGQQLTNLVNQNVARNSPSAPTQTTQTNANKPNVGTNSDVNNLLYQIVSNFYRQRDMTVTSPEQMYADLKADQARKNVVRNHIRASGNPSTNQLVALFDSKTK